jgi:hypothetical protein
VLVEIYPGAYSLKEELFEIIDKNEHIMKLLKTAVCAIVKEEVKEKMFKRNLFINKNSVLFYLLFKHKLYDVIDEFVKNFKYLDDKKTK